ncbi:hypothetical protein AAMO2058_001561700 [Amorphochlora amoebiformis]|uniref:Uncharacterized protein n=1 Tax=Amorphochlora amoebiformis TaxID=1561963 RepID=A0A7S0DQE0_9EUKA|mmetsp:Transcript_5908/g.9068  ORF Transcript_5908/g.9068 Transcript_5908/m.9068 type:complete len:519 (+) Transcript_5908:98-1654(+)
MLSSVLSLAAGFMAPAVELFFGVAFLALIWILTPSPCGTKNFCKLLWKRFRVVLKLIQALGYLSLEEAQQLDEYSGSAKQLAELLSFASEIAYDADIPAQVNVVESKPNEPQNILAIDIGGTRTKLMVARQWSDVVSTSLEDIVKNSNMHILPPIESSVLWAERDDVSSDTSNIYDTKAVAQRIQWHLRKHLPKHIYHTDLHRVIFSVPGTVELAGVYRDRLTVVKNMPSFSKNFRGLDFQKAFGSTFPRSKISAMSDNMGAALGAACLCPEVKSGLVLVLGTAPAVATFFRDPSGKDKYIETGIWQSWVWFSKIPLDDPHGYCGGIKTDKATGKIVVKPPGAYKIPHRQARIRFALDNNTWERFMGRNKYLDKKLQKPLDVKEATAVWSGRLQSSLNKLAEKFHDIYGPPEVVYVLGGNATRCHGIVTHAQYETTDHSMKVTVPVVIPREDRRQQMMHMAGLVYSTQFKVKQVFAPGQDPLARGWTRGGEICMWVKRKEYRSKKVGLGTGASKSRLD